ncbi:MAG: acyl-CoA dehydrogenase, partial [Desulfobacteraceae bacterium]|nr:acyl-CoA dehydrogenase [Desulfobacteraceae bacterium]
MEILKYTEEHEKYREKLRVFFEKEVTPYADKWEEDHAVPKEVWRKVGQAGLLCPLVPEEYGGIGGDFSHVVVYMEEFAKTKQSGLMLTLHNDIVVPYILAYGTEEVKKKYLPKCVSGECITAVAMTEPAVGSDLS